MQAGGQFETSQSRKRISFPFLVTQNHRSRGSRRNSLAQHVGARYLEAVSRFESIVDDLRSLPPERLEMAADYIKGLKPVSDQARREALDRTFGCLSPEEADELDRIIEEGCEEINEHGW